ncbi:hypothetical protein [Pseudomonas sp. PA27(2017)]|uniref:hypothetical protein n=1 Tax=Pseudomonas sp. PA27(2017) TaxID=1932112 RepID=UPI0009621FD1|nr:hypothetical protein [Pseudomonas sp. PA27(2017)]OLU23925.1 hypothetical protein BVH06_22400 [Pseudomonas sp. PA27(2017)]
MKDLLMGFALSIFITTTCNANEVSFYIGQSHNDWALNVVGKGKAIVGETLIYTEYEYIKFTNNPKHNKSRKVEYVAFDYAYLTPNGRWDIKNTGVQKKIVKTFKPGEWMTINWIDTKLRLHERKPSSYWIVVTIATD